MDPVTISVAVGIAGKAFDAIKKGFAVGRDIEQMSGDIGRWMGAVSDVDNAEKQAKNPPLFGKLFKAGSIEEAAMAAYAAKKKLEEQRYELKKQAVSNSATEKRLTTPLKSSCQRKISKSL